MQSMFYQMAVHRYLQVLALLSLSAPVVCVYCVAKHVHQSELCHNAVKAAVA
jgi:L-lysine 2,3-aminomutase